MTKKTKQPQDLPEYVPCKNCKKLISPGRNRRRETCNQACKQAYYRKKKAGLVTDEQP